MERLLNIDRPEGFPLCAETLKVLNENSEMFSEWLKGIPLKNRQAVVFGDHLLVCQNLQKRWVKKGAVRAASINQCKLVFQLVEDVTVHDNAGNDINGVWMREKADIVDETAPGAQWTILGLGDIFELKLWYDALPLFEAGLPGSIVSDGSFIEEPHLLYYADNILRQNAERTQIKLDVAYHITADLSTKLSLPFPAECPDGTRMEADLEVVSTGKHYPIRVYAEGGMLIIDIGKWLKDEGLFTQHGHNWKECDDIIRINKEVLL